MSIGGVTVRGQFIFDSGWWPSQARVEGGSGPLSE